MRSHRALLVGLCALCLGLVAGWMGRGLAAPEAVLPGSEQDPLVTKSYVDMRLAELSGSSLAVVEVPAGKALIGSAGTELILRAGTAKAIDSDMGGLSDVTDGADLREGHPIPRNHLLIIPRDDGRGILAVNAIIVLVRGSYAIR
ncbi:MAG: hypothetical protein ACOX3V_07935 [Bacillota bacterium]|jgi:hypothetical protein